MLKDMPDVLHRAARRLKKNKMVSPFHFLHVMAPGQTTKHTHTPNAAESA